MGACVSGELSESYLPQLSLDGSTLDVAVRKSATRILLLRIRPADQQRIRAIQSREARKVAIEVLVTVPSGALSAVRVTVQRDPASGGSIASAASSGPLSDLSNPANWSATGGYTGRLSREAAAQPVRYDAHGRVIPPVSAGSDTNSASSVHGGTAYHITPQNAAAMGADDNTGVSAGFYGPFATGMHTPAGWVTYVPHHVTKRTRPPANRRAGSARYGYTDDGYDAFGQPIGVIDEDLGLGGIRFRITAAQTRNFSAGDYYISMVCVEDGRALVTAGLEVEDDGAAVASSPFAQSQSLDSTGYSQPGGYGSGHYGGAAHQQYYKPTPDYARTHSGAGHYAPPLQQQHQLAAQAASQQEGYYSAAHPHAAAVYPHYVSPMEAHYNGIDRFAIENDTAGTLSQRQRAYIEEQHALIVDLRNRLGTYEEELGTKIAEIDDLRATRPTQAKFFDLEEKYRALRDENREIRNRLQDTTEHASLQQNDLVATLESQLHAYKLHAKKSKEIILKLNDKVDEKRRKVALLEAEIDTLRKRLHYKGAGASSTIGLNGSAAGAASASGLERAKSRLNYEGRDMNLYRYLTRKEYAVVQVQKVVRGMLARKRLGISPETTRRRRRTFSRSGSSRSSSSRHGSSSSSSSKYRSSSRRSRSRSRSRSPRGSSSTHRSSSRHRSRSRSRSPHRSSSSHRRSSRSRSRSRSRSPHRSSSSSHYSSTRGSTLSSSLKSPSRKAESNPYSKYAYGRAASSSSSKSPSRSSSSSKYTSSSHRPSSSSSRSSKGRYGGYATEEDYAAAKIQGGFRGMQARRALKAKGHRSYSTPSGRTSSSHKSSSHRSHTTSSVSPTRSSSSIRPGSASSKSLLKQPGTPTSNTKKSIQFGRDQHQAHSSSSSSSSSKKTREQEDALIREASRKYGIDLNDPEVQRAASKIQAGYRGHLFRKKNPEKVVKHKSSSSSRSSKSSSSSKHGSSSSSSSSKHSSSKKDSSSSSAPSLSKRLSSVHEDKESSRPSSSSSSSHHRSSSKDHDKDRDRDRDRDREGHSSSSRHSSSGSHHGSSSKGHSSSSSSSHSSSKHKEGSSSSSSKHSSSRH